jgi:hypothetical protein
METQEQRIARQRRMHDLQFKTLNLIYIILVIVGVIISLYYVYLHFFGTCAQIAESFQVLSQVPARCITIIK